MEPRLLAGLGMLVILGGSWVTRPLDTRHEDVIRRLVRDRRPPGSMSLHSQDRLVWDLALGAVWAVAALSLIAQGIVAMKGTPVVTLLAVGLAFLAGSALLLPRRVHRFRRASALARQDFDVWLPLLWATGLAVLGSVFTVSGLVALFR